MITQNTGSYHGLLRNDRTCKLVLDDTGNGAERVPAAGQAASPLLDDANVAISAGARGKATGAALGQLRQSSIAIYRRGRRGGGLAVLVLHQRPGDASQPAFQAHPRRPGAVCVLCPCAPTMRGWSDVVLQFCNARLAGVGLLHLAES